MTAQSHRYAPAMTTARPHRRPTRRTPSLIAVALLALGVAACGRGDGTGAGALVVSVDSAGGVPHVRSAGSPPLWRLDSTLALTDAGGEPFGRVTGVVGDWRGGVYVADAGARRVHRFAADGAYLGALGGGGAGRGEIRAMTGLAWVAGRLATLDTAEGHIVLLAADGEGAPQQLPWQPPRGDAWLEQTRPGEAYAPTMVPAAGDERPRRAFVRLIGAGVPDTVPDFRGPAAGPSAPGTADCLAGIEGESIAIPYATRPFAARAPERRTVVGNTGGYRLALLGAGGDTLRVIERDEPAVPLTDAEWRDAESYWAGVRARIDSAGCDVPAVQRPASKPAFRTVLWDDRGRLWVEAATADGFRLDVYDSTGALVGELPAPPRDPTVPLAIRTGRLFWVTADSSGAQTVRVARVVDLVAAPDSAASGR